MPAITVLAAAAAAWCFLQGDSRHLEALAGGAGPKGNFLDSDQWLSTVSQYDRDKYWNRFRDFEEERKIITHRLFGGCSQTALKNQCTV